MLNIYHLISVKRTKEGLRTKYEELISKVKNEILINLTEKSRMELRCSQLVLLNHMLVLYPK